MKTIFDFSSVQRVLQHGVNRGLWTIADLDTPSPDYTRNLSESRTSKYFGAAYQPPKPYANPLRSANTGEAVQPISPRDFDVAAAARPNEGRPNMDLLPRQWPPVPRFGHEPDISSEKNTATDCRDHGHQGDLGTTGQHDPQGPGGDGASALQPQPTAEPVSTAPW